MTSIAIVGANGRLGQAATLAFHQAGYRVIAVSRSGNLNLPVGIEQRAANALNQAALIQATTGAELILNALNPPYARWQSEVLTLGRNVLAAAKAHQATHLFIGNVYNYGTQIPAQITPNTLFQADHLLAQVRVDLETLFKQAAIDQQVQTLIIRAGDFYGASQGTWVDLSLLRDLKKGRFTYPSEHWEIPHAWAYLPDLAQAFVALAQQAPKLPMFAQWLFAGHNFTGEQLLTLSENYLGKPLKRAPTPWGLFKVLGVVNKNFKLLTSMRYLWNKPHQLIDTRLATWNFMATPAELAYQQTLQILKLS